MNRFIQCVATECNRIDFIRATGKQAIVFPYTPNSNARIIMEIIHETGGTENQCLFCARSGFQSYSNTLFKVSNSYRWDYYNQMINSIAIKYNQKTTIEVNCNNLYIDNVLRNTTTSNVFTCGSNLCILASINGNTSRGYYDNFFSGKIYSFSVIDKDFSIICHPAKRRKGEIFGLYDVINHKFYSSSTDTNFL